MGLHRWQRSLAIALFLGAWAVLSWPWLSGAVTIPYDAKALFQAELQFLANAIHQGQSPFWSPNVFGGIPQIADPQSLIFSPMVLLALLAPHPSFHSLDVAVLALLALAGLAVLMFFRDRGWHPAGGIVAALAFAFGASAAWRIQHIGQIESFVFFAVALWLLARALERASVPLRARGRRRGRADADAAGSGRVPGGAVSRRLRASTTGSDSRAWRDALVRSLKPLAAATLAADHHRGADPAHGAVRRVRATARRIAYAEATRGSLHPASLLTLLVGGLFSPDYAVPYWGPYSVAWDPSGCSCRRT